MMEEASRYAANPPEMGLTGEADPSQVESFRAEGKQHMQTVQASELEQTRQDFGEERIQPKPDPGILRSAQGIRAVAPPAFSTETHRCNPARCGRLPQSSSGGSASGLHGESSGRIPERQRTV
ncbi:hypothetical protein ACFSQ7_39860 [Paenibacillus rhizoplanae]